MAGSLRGWFRIAGGVVDRPHHQDTGKAVRWVDVVEEVDVREVGDTMEGVVEATVR